MAYATLSDLRSYIGVTDQVDDVQLQIALNATESMIDAYCGRSFSPAGTAATARVYASHLHALVFVDDCTAVTLVETDPSGDGSWTDTWAASGDWQAEPLNGVSEGLSVPYTQLRAVGDYLFPVSAKACVRVTARWGWGQTPNVIEQAVLLQAARLSKRRDSVTGVMGGPETGLIRVGRAIDADVAQLLAPYRKGATTVGIA